MPLNARLVVVGGEVKTAEIKLRLPSTIGRGRGATIMLPHPLVSRQHCELFEADGRLMVRDLGSLNGTFINNQRISEAPLPAGDLLTVGAVTFRAVYEVQEGSSPPAGSAAPAKTGKIRDTDSNGTGRPQPPKKPAAEPVEDEVDFNFDQPLTPVDDSLRITVSPEANDKTDVPAEVIAVVAEEADKKAALAKTVPAPSKSKPAAEKPAEAAKSAPAKPAAPAPAKPAQQPAAKDEKPVNFAAWDLEDQVDPKGESDDDFGDFLKSLGSK
jgi:predicted component of type VI protein secretion system